jgi:heptaprenyl diphosphate synthase
MNKKIAYMGLFGAVAILFGYIESMFPVFVTLPGVKLGIANLVTMLMIYIYSWKEAAAVSVVRIFVIGFLFGNLFSIAYSLAGGAISLLVMLLIKRIPGFSISGCSIAGGVAHNIGQLLVAMVLVDSFSLMYYLPILLISGAVTGLVVGLVAAQVLVRIRPLLVREKGGRS